MTRFQEALRKFSDVLLLGVLTGVSLVLVVPFGPVFLAGCRLARRSQHNEDTSFKGFIADVGTAFRTPLTTVVVPSVLIVLIAVDLLILAMFPLPIAGVFGLVAGALIAALLFGAAFAGMTWRPLMLAQEWARSIRATVGAHRRRAVLIAGAATALVLIVWVAPLSIIVMLGPLCLASTWADAHDPVA